jgi:hypothetical protein
MFCLSQIIGAMVIVLFACSRADAIFTIKVTMADGTSIYDTIARNANIRPPTADGKDEWNGTVFQTNVFALQWDLLLDYDHAGLSGPLSIRNTSDGPETITISVSLPVLPGGAPAGFRLFGASGISIADSNGDGTASLTAPPENAAYNAFTAPNSNGIDPAVLLQSLFTGSYGLTINTLGGTLADVQSFNDLKLTSTLNVIGIQHNFVLSTGDTATFNSTVGVVPEPSTATLAVVALICASVICSAVFRRRDAMCLPRRGNSQ